MKKLILFLLTVLAFQQSSAQVIDIGKLTRYPYTYGNRYNRAVIDSAFAPPTDTVNNKVGIARIGAILYVGDSSKWVAAGGAGPINLGADITDSSVTVTSPTGTSSVIGAATSSLAGVMSADDKIKLDSVYTASGTYKYWGTNGAGQRGFYTIHSTIELSTHIVTTGTYTIADSVSTVIIDAASDVDLYLPDPEDYDKREITIKNPSENQALFTIPVYYSSTVSSTSLAAGKWIHIKSDNGLWWVTQESGVTSSTTITGGSGGLSGNLD